MQITDWWVGGWRSGKHEARSYPPLLMSQIVLYLNDMKSCTTIEKSQWPERILSLSMTSKKPGQYYSEMKERSGNSPSRPRCICRRELNIHFKACPLSLHPGEQCAHGGKLSTANILFMTSGVVINIRHSPTIKWCFLPHCVETECAISIKGIKLESTYRRLGWRRATAARPFKRLSLQHHRHLEP